MKTTFSRSLGFSFAVWVTLLVSAATIPAADQLLDIALVPRLTIQGTLGATHQIQYRTNLTQTNWIVLTNVLVQQTNYWFVDVGAPSGSSRFYRVVTLSPPGMVLIPAGSFVMGDTADGNPSALPLHTVSVSAFFMDQNDVSKALWDQVKAWNGGNGYNYENPGSAKADTHPVQSVNWRDCVKWCNARSEMEGRTPCYYNEPALTTVYKVGTNTPYANWNANGYRLPTEAEWEKGARGGANGQRFPWGSTISWVQANYYANPPPALGSAVYDVNPIGGNDPIFNDGVYPYTSPVGYFGANAYWLYDMAGNVWEWCWDWYEDYTAGAQSDPRGPASGPGHMYRGGAWNSPAFSCRTAARYYATPDSTSNGTGFRCVVAVGQ